MDCRDRVIHENAYIPEHLPEYFIPFSSLECIYTDPYMYYFRNADLRVIGYPLRGSFDEERFVRFLEGLVSKYKPKVLSVITPAKLVDYPFKINYYESDHYYILSLDNIHMNKKLRNIIRRAKRDLSIKISREFRDVHWGLIKKFCKRKKISRIYFKMYSKIPDYINYSNTVYLIEAWRNDDLIAFTIYEDAAKKYGFYLFNFTEDKNKYVPGSSDILFKKCIEIARESGKEYINMGLGINEGIKFFKSKWGGRPVYEYNFIITYLE
jgi:hypothetical protein